jgi:hypothetical protein
MLISGVTTFTNSSAEEASLLGNGRKDTQTIVRYLGTTETGRAAQLCANRTSGGTDWFLPSAGELNQLYLNRDAVNTAGGNLGTNRFWSSSQHNSWYAKYQSFSGSQGYLEKNSTSSITRAVRAF